ncbi:MAG TPA: TIGR02569 family protein [Pseudonocardiaceae bacterium]
MTSTNPPPQHVCAAFGVGADEPRLLDGGTGPVWRAQDVVLKPVASTAEAAWVAQTLDALRVDGVRLARPVRASDGRWVVSGWSAARYVAGRPEPRYDELVAVSLRLHEATAHLPRPRFLANRTDVWAVADRAAWGDGTPALDPATGGTQFAEVLGHRRPLALREQIVHGDLFGNVLFAGSAAPAVIDFSAYWRPPEWAAAVIVVDALAWGDADENLALRWAELAQWPQVLVRALLFRLAAHALHPRSTPASLAGLLRAVTLVRELL